MTDAGFLDLPDLAAEAVGGAAIQCTDEFFSAKDALVRDCAPAQDEGRVTDRGKWMDGWETRRRRAPGHDSCVIRLGLPGVIRGVVIDTTHVRSTCPEQASLEACVVDGPLDLEELERAEWTEILPRAALLEDRKNEFAIAADRRFTHVRLNIFPDGGVARLRVHGEVVPRWARLRGHGGLVELAALANGALVEACSDERAGSHLNLIRPGAARGSSEGWQPRRRAHSSECTTRTRTTMSRSRRNCCSAPWA
ncbi:MAG TPA: hypothetical protein PKU97_14335 [Kofleriaceae bacterium]|nr:hypothetical protein [Kofleriaceae bacterium]